MSTLEQQAKPILEPMISGTARVTLGHTEQAVLATWCVKTALVRAAKFEPGLPDALYERLRIATAAGPTDRIWIGRTAGREFTFSDLRPLKVRPAEEPEPETVNAYAALLALGHFATYVVGWVDSEPDTSETLARFGEGLVEIWPGSDRVHWPPPGTLTLVGLNTLADVIAGPALPADHADWPSAS